MIIKSGDENETQAHSLTAGTAMLKKRRQMTQQQAYHAAIIDARTVGRDGVTAYNDVLRAADNAGMEVVAILILSEAQAHWKAEARTHARGAVLTDPGVTMKQLLRTLDDLAPTDTAPAK